MSGVARTNLEELGQIAGTGQYAESEDEDEDWVSENCVKGVVIGLLGLIADDQEDHIAKVGLLYEICLNHSELIMF